MATKITNKQVKIVSTVDFNGQEITNALIDANHNTITNLDTGKVDDVKVNGTSVVANKIADIQIKTINGTEIIGEGDVEIQSPILTFTSIGATNWVADNTYTGYGYKCDLVCEEVTSSMVPQVTFASVEADSGNYCAICDSGTDKITIYSKVNTTITVPTITATNTTQEPPTPTEFKGLKFTAIENNGSIGYRVNGTPTGTDMKYSYDGNAWVQWDGTDIPLNDGEFIYVKGDNPNGLNKDSSNNIQFYLNTLIKASGNINSLLDNSDGSSITVIPNDYCFVYLFGGIGSDLLITAPELPATTLTESCYENMFFGCSSLTQAPELPATILAPRCYKNMFSGCNSLTQAPNLPATTLAIECYRGMFSNCNSLIQAPELPVATLSSGCYREMFLSCTSLVTSPELPSIAVPDSCYEQMFKGCSSLTQAPDLPAVAVGYYSYENMFESCTSLVKGPEISAIALNNFCFREMFKNCSSLNYIKLKYTQSFNTANGEFFYWVQGVSQTGDFYYNGNDTTRGVSAIPTGWTVHTF